MAVSGVKHLESGLNDGNSSQVPHNEVSTHVGQANEKAGQ